jgi:hypothetical protein
VAVHYWTAAFAARDAALADDDTAAAAAAGVSVPSPAGALLVTFVLLLFTWFRFSLLWVGSGARKKL